MMRPLDPSRRLRFPLLPFLLLLATGAPLAAQQATSDLVPLTPEVRHGKLPNGLSYFIRANPRPAGRADLRLIVNAGSILEDDDQLGAAHFIEHMSFNGTKRFPKNQLVSYLQSIGVRLGGDLNATTGFDETTYILPIPTADREVLNTGLAILREWAGNALLTDEDIETERAVVLAEMRSGEAAEARIQRLTLSRMFNGSRYAARLPIGTEQSLRGMSPNALRRFYHDWYRPDLEAVIVVGDINVDEIEARIKALFSDLVPVPNPRARPALIEIPRRTSAEALVATDPELKSGRVDVTMYLRPAPSMATVGAYDALIEDQLVNRMLGMRFLEMMDRPVRPFLGARAQRSATVRGYEAFTATAVIAGQNPIETARLLATEVERARRFGFGAEELEAAKRDVINNYTEANAERDKSESDSLADELGRHFLTDEPVPGIAWEYGRVSYLLPRVTVEMIDAHAQTVLGEPGAQPFVMLAAPSADGVTEAALRDAVTGALRAELTPYRGVKVDTQLLGKEPEPGGLVSETPDAALGTTTLAYANGVRVVLKPTGFKNDEVVLGAARYGGQYLYDTPDHQNAVHLIDFIDAMGYGTFTPSALQRFLATRSANASVQFEPYVEGLAGGSTRTDLSTLLQLVYLKLTSPRLDPERFEASRTALKGYLASLWNSPETHFDDFSMAVLSQRHPRAPRVPRPADLDQVNAERSVAMYRERFGNASGMTFVLVGSFSVEEARPLITRYLGGLPGSPRRESGFRDVGVRYAGGGGDRVLQKGTDNSALSIVYTGQHPYSRDEKLKLAALTEVLNLRVVDRIREELGSSYSPGVVSRFSRVPVGEYMLRFSIGCAVAEMPTVERAIDQIVQALQANGPTPAELEKVTRTWLNEYETTSQTNAWWADRLQDRALDPELDDGENYVGRVKALTVADLQAAARTYADPANRARLVLEPESAPVAR